MNLVPGFAKIDRRHLWREASLDGCMARAPCQNLGSTVAASTAQKGISGLRRFVGVQESRPMFGTVRR
jgi:hypothetical protein